MRIIINKKTYYWFPLQEKISVGPQTSEWSNLKEKLVWGWLGGKCRVNCSAKLQIIQGEIYEKEKLRRYLYWLRLEDDLLTNGPHDNARDHL